MTPAEDVEIIEAILEAVRPLVERIAVLEAQIVTLQTRALKDGGIWRVGVRYEPADVVTAKGSAWVCIKAHEAVDPFAHGSWRLLLKGSKP